MHRLNTVMDSTKILVLNRGELAEYGKPSDLLNNTAGIFTSMVEATGPDQSTYLRVPYLICRHGAILSPLSEPNNTTQRVHETN